MSSDSVTYTICFCDSDPHLLKPFLKRGYSHCYAIKHTEDHYININSNRSHIEIDALYKTDDAFNDLIAGTVSLTVTIEIHERSIAGLRWLSCVESVKSLLGISAPLLLTPHQLYKRLLK